MRLPLALAALAAATVLAFVHPLPAAASPRAPLTCSAEQGYDAVAASDVIVAGRIIRHEIIEAPPPEPRGSYTPVELHMDIDRVLKGSVAPRERIVDVASLVLGGDGQRLSWSGGGGACGAIDHEPDGWYAILGLRRVGNGLLETNRLTTFYLREEPYTQETLALLDERIGLPAAGTGAPGHRDVPMTVIVLATIGTAALVAGSVSRRTRR